DEVHLVGAHQLLVSPHHRLGFATVVEADQLDLAFLALHAEAPASVHLVGPQDVVRLLRHLRPGRPRAGAGDRVADLDWRVLRQGRPGEQQREAEGNEAYERCRHDLLLQKRWWSEQLTT